MSVKSVALLATLALGLLISACRQPAATPTAAATASRPQPTPTPTPAPAATAIGMPLDAGDHDSLHPDLPHPDLTPGWTTFAITRPVTALAQAADGAIWVGHDDGGYRFPAHAPGDPWVALSGELADTAVNTFFPLPTGMWVGHDGGASFFSYATEEWSHLRPAVAPSAGLYRGDVQMMAADGDGRLWFGTSGGVTVWDGQRFFYDDFLTVEERFARQRPHFVYALLFDGANVWVGTERGLFSYDGAYQLTRHDPANLQAEAGGPTPAVRALTLDDGGRLLIAADRRLLRLEDDGAFTTLFIAEASAQGGTHGHVHSIAVTAGDVWLGLGDDRLLRGRDGQWQAAAAGPDGAPISGRHVLVDYLGARWFAAEDGGHLIRYVP